MSGESVSRNDPCPCGSGKKYKKCCGQAALADRSEPSMVTYPLGTVAHYGPDDKTATKIAAGVYLRPDAEVIIERWVATDIDHNEKIQAEVIEFFKSHGVRQIVTAPEIMGCPHEEGMDFPDGEDCPFCPFWRGKQGSARRM